MLEDIQHRLDGIEAGALRSTRATYCRAQQQNQPTPRDVHEDDTDKKVKTKGYLRTHVRKPLKPERPVLTNTSKRLPHITLGISHAKFT